MEWIGLIVLGLILIVSVVILWMVLRERTTPIDLEPIESRFDLLEKLQDRLEDSVRERLLESREEAGKQSAALRKEVQESVKNLGTSVTESVSTLSKLQDGRMNSFSDQLGRAGDGFQDDAKKLREEVSKRLGEFNGSLVDSFSKLGETQKGQLDSFSTHLGKLIESNEKKFQSLQESVEKKLDRMQQDNAKKLEEMRQTVDEKLQGTLEKRLGESFNHVSEQLQRVYKGLGEMQSLAKGVGDVKKVLTNVKTRGTWGEVAAGNLLEQVLSPEQFARNVCTKEGSGGSVEFAIKLPGQGGSLEDTVWLPIDAKFPKEVYERLIDASEVADGPALELATKEFEKTVKSCAKSISEKYINPPETTDFGIMFMASEGLYAEVVRRPGLVDEIQRKYRIVVAGPTTLCALLNSLQVGFKTLAIQKRSSEVWQVLAGVRTEFAKFGDVLKKVKRHLKHASSSIEKVGVRTRAINRRLKGVEELPREETAQLTSGMDSEIPEEALNGENTELQEV